MIPYGSLVIYMTPKGKRYLKRLTEDEDWHSKDGILFSRDIAQADFGDTVMTSMGKPIQVMEATLQDRLKGVKRQTQIIYPKDIAYICMRLGAGPGRVICEAGRTLLVLRPHGPCRQSRGQGRIRQARPPDSGMGRARRQRRNSRAGCQERLLRQKRRCSFP